MTDVCLSVIFLFSTQGIPPSKISELHGNVFVERCEKCDTRYQRSFYVCDDIADIYLEELEDYGKSDVIPPKFMLKCRKCGLSHRTGRICERKVSSDLEIVVGFVPYSIAMS